MRLGWILIELAISLSVTQEGVQFFPIFDTTTSLVRGGGEDVFILLETAKGRSFLPGDVTFGKISGF